MTRSRLSLLLSIVTLAAACEADRPELPPEGQVVLYVTTDALLPDPPDQPDRSSGLFDRLSFEIFPPGESTPCAGCSREFAVDRRMVDEGRASIGYVPPPGVPGTRVRVRLYRTKGAEVAGPRPTSTLETVIALPTVGADGIVPITAVLETSSLGSPAGTLDEPVAPRSGLPERGLVGTWEAERRRPCVGEPGEGEVCIPGGAYWLGVPSVALPFPDTKRGLEHLVVVSPFFIDATEVTVKAFRAAKLADGTGPGQNIADALCNFSTAPDSPLDDHPLNCVGFGKADEFCKKKGARLPTEGEYEYAATALGRNTKYPWGEDTPTCADAVFGRANEPGAIDAQKVCAPAKGTTPVGTSARDRFAPLAGGAEILDLAGNVAEWMSDDYADEWEPCWNAPILLDPKCANEKEPEPRRAVRGGAYSSAAANIDVKTRSIGTSDPTRNPYNTGFRCARSSD